MQNNDSQEDKTIQIAIGKYIAQAAPGGRAEVNITQQLPPSYLTKLEERNRNKLLNKVYKDWISGVLENSLYKKESIELDFEYKLEAVVRPWEAAVQESSHDNKETHIIKNIYSIFNNSNGELLILGEPGSGKTTLLLDLAKTLIVKAQEDATYPIPTIFHLSFWSKNPVPIDHWLIEELGERYSLPPKIARKWIDNSYILPLFDGLDEVKLECRSDCIDAINLFRKKYGLLNLVVCSRVRDYQILNNKLKLQSAIIIKPLTKQKISNFLTAAGDKSVNLISILESDRELQELAKIPLMLSIMLMVYQQEKSPQVSLQNSEPKHKQLFQSYIDEMFGRRSKNTSYSPKATIRWLTWLASQMNRENQTLFFIEEMNQSWLEKDQRRAYLWLFKITIKLLISICVLASLGGYFGLTYGLIMGLITFISYRPKDEYTKIVGTIGWDWSAVKENFSKALQSEFSWILTLILLSLITSQSILNTIIVGTILFILSSLTSILISGVTGKELEHKIYPNLGTFRSITYGSIIGIIKGFSMGILGIVLAFSSNLTTDLNLSYVRCFFVWALYGVVTGWLKYGGQTSLQHFFLRIFIWLDNLMPWNYSQFLDYAAERFFLYKVGGGYMFIHNLPRNYFASIEREYSKQKSNTLLNFSVKYYLLPFIIAALSFVVFTYKLVTAGTGDYSFNKLKYHIENGHYAEAVSYANQVIKYDRRNSIAFIYRGISHNNLESYKDAISDFENAMALENKGSNLYLKALNNRAVTYIRTKKYTSALEDLNEATQLQFSYATLVNRSFVYNELSMYDQALDDSNSVVAETEPNINLISLNALVNRGRAHHGMGENQKAINNFNIVIQETKNITKSQNSSSMQSFLLLQVSALSYRAEAYSVLENYDLAIRDCESSIQITENLLNFHRKLEMSLLYKSCGVAQMYQGNYEQAIMYYSLSIKEDSENAEALEHRGIIYSNLGRLDQAEQDLQFAMQLYKDQGKIESHQRTLAILSALR